MNVTVCHKNDQPKIIKYWRLCCNCIHARFAVLRSKSTKTMQAKIYLFECPHVSCESIEGGKHQSKPSQEKDMVATSFSLYEWALQEHPIKWKKPKGEKNDGQYQFEYFEIPPKLWFEFFGSAVAGKLEPCPKCSNEKSNQSP